jgi:hypothetical protein
MTLFEETWNAESLRSLRCWRGTAETADPIVMQRHYTEVGSGARCLDRYGMLPGGSTSLRGLKKEDRGLFGPYQVLLRV